MTDVLVSYPYTNDDDNDDESSKRNTIEITLFHKIQFVNRNDGKNVYTREES